MSDRNQSFVDNFSGVVNILTEDSVLFQGQILRENCDDRKTFQPFQNGLFNGNEFIILELRCEPAIIRDNANLQTINPPLYQQGDIVRIRRSQIVSVGPGTGCIAADHDDD